MLARTKKRLRVNVLTWILFSSVAILVACKSQGNPPPPLAAQPINTDSRNRAGDKSSTIVPAKDEDPYDRAAAISSATMPSNDLATDLKLMWETKLISGDASGVAVDRRFASTYRAINAASRVFNTVDLKGMTRDQVIARLGDPRTSSNSIYNFPFYPPKSGDLVYRFDAGNGGWQFNIHFDSEGKVSAAERLGIS